MYKRLYASFSALGQVIASGELGNDEQAESLLANSLFCFFFTCREKSLGKEGLEHLKRKMRHGAESVFPVLEKALLKAEREGRAMWFIHEDEDKLGLISEFLAANRLQPLILNGWPQRMDCFQDIEEKIKETNPDLEVVWHLPLR